ncbi:flagellin modification protein PtmA [Campylobacter lari]|uniref:Glucosamine-6-P synthase, glutaminase subunit PtmA n=1 Tax=Campylobacter lari (strain RM2100 / D67 / ATCC BAA-1060) TaxID=306263 RepID=B9KDB0_CAMLR|nr:oxidoreductase [Campylobacter lari]ACM64549.1 glucosamine-6-P synthase, glutaminase subunit PtmA [Campylobacter lari RM2100]EAJ0336928.1 SDR family oxidoreductase [Campylobacter lari]EAJ6453098.1 SDR family oxidoreductase [Campylobacter lari]EAK6012572.1 SDR family oxidoreductase [Campylobacter lari]MCV3441445.1 flagellin modification protein A [Campylobacter lari]
MLKEKVVFIAGACGRIGKALSRACLYNKAKIIIADIDEEKLKQLKKDLNNDENILCLKLDISNKEQINHCLNESVLKFNKIDAFINCAYPYGKDWGKVAYYEASYEKICEDLNLHLASFIFIACEFVKFFKKQGFGNIINLSSIMGVYAPKFENYENTSMQSPLEYSVIKAGINHLGVWLAKELFNTNIRVNSVAFGGIKDNQPEIFLNAYRKCCASKGMLDSDDICGTLVFLISDNSKFITGQTIIVDDGWGL